MFFIQPKITYIHWSSSSKIIVFRRCCGAGHFGADPDPWIRTVPLTYGSGSWQKNFVSQFFWLVLFEGTLKTVLKVKKFFNFLLTDPMKTDTDPDPQHAYFIDGGVRFLSRHYFGVLSSEWQRWRNRSGLDISYMLLNCMCRACMHSFFIDCQSTRELRITSISRDAAI